MKAGTSQSPTAYVNANLSGQSSPRQMLGEWHVSKGRLLHASPSDAFAANHRAAHTMETFIR